MRLLISENEKQRILKLHNPRFLFEQVDVTIADLQSLIGVTADNNLGPQTANRLLEVLRTIPGNGCSANFVPPTGGGGAKSDSTVPADTKSKLSSYVKNPINFAGR